MTSYGDLSEYSYHRSKFFRPGTKNIGWIGAGSDFECAESTEETLQAVWEHCKISIAYMPGIHRCEFCNDFSYYAERNGEYLLLGGSEIRVFSPSGEIYAAPTLIYHYMHAHYYAPPLEFLWALHEGPVPGSSAYFDRLKELGMEWSKTSAPAKKTAWFRFDPEGAQASQYQAQAC
jgi:hypothetical protein